MYALLRPLLFSLPPDVAHSAGMAALAPIEHLAPLRALVRALFARPDASLRRRVMGLDFPSPLGVAAGFDKNALRARALSALGFGHVEIGTVTALAQEGNPRPSLFRLPKDRALINRLGFPNEGAQRVAARIAARGGARAMGVPLGVSIGKSRAVPLSSEHGDPLRPAIDDYLASFRAVRDVADFVVVNVSSPNTKDLRAMQGAVIARALLSALAREASLPSASPFASKQAPPLLVKIAPDLDDAALEALLAVVAEVGIAGVVATNTTIARAGLSTDASAVAAIGAGGLSGAPLRARALAVVARVRARLGGGVAVIGVGGVERAEHAQALLDAGADLVQMYTGFIYQGPLCAWSIARGLARARNAP